MKTSQYAKINKMIGDATTTDQLDKVLKLISQLDVSVDKESLARNAANKYITIRQ